MKRDEEKQVKLTLGDIEALKRKGLNQSEIAQLYGVTRQYVSWIKHTYNGKLTARELVGREFPFRVSDQFTRTTQYKRLRDHGEYVATEGVGMSSDKLSRLRGWYRKLRRESLVVEFDPSNPPEPGVSSTGGFTYRPRMAEDEDLLVRRNEWCELSPEGDRIWRFPQSEP